MTKTVLVTGGTGFIAGWCIVDLLKRGYRVRTTIRSATRQAAVRAAIAPHVMADDRLSFAIADLTADEGWASAMEGCDAVLHVASPLGRETPRDRDALLAPARDGTLRVLRSAVAAGAKRIVMTSAAATARVRGSGAVSDEAMWADPEDPLLDPYRRSKILAERAAWDFMEAQGSETAFTTILPGAVFGPILGNGDPGSVWVILNMLKGKPPRLIDLGLSVVDVRDLAKAHVDALESEAASGERILATGHFVWMREIAEMLRSGLGARGAKVPVKTLPNALVRIVALFQPQLRMFLPDLGQKRLASNAKAGRLLGFAPRATQETLIDCAESLIAAGLT